MVSAGRGDEARLYRCAIATCDAAARLASGVFGSPNVNPDGTQLIALRSGAAEPVYLPLSP